MDVNHRIVVLHRLPARIAADGLTSDALQDVDRRAVREAGDHIAAGARTTARVGADWRTDVVSGGCLVRADIGRTADRP